MKKVGIIVLLIILLAANAYPQTVIYDNTQAASFSTYSTTYLLQRFDIVDANKYITEVSLLLNKTGTPSTEQFTISIFNYVETGYNVGTKVTDLYTGFISGLSASPSLMTINMYNKTAGLWPVQLQTGNSYWLAVYSATASTNGPSWGYTDVTSGSFGPGFALDSREGTSLGSLSGSLENPFQMRIKAIDKPALPMVGRGYGNFSIALKSDGKAYTWGYNNYGQLGTGTAIVKSTVPIAVSTSGVLNNKTIKWVAAGQEHCILLDEDGKVYTWGYNNKGQVGDSTFNNRNAPVAVLYGTAGLLSKKIISVSAGTSHSLALDDQGKVYTWGDNIYGKLGDNTNTHRNTPVAVLDGTAGLLTKRIIQVVGGFGNSIALDDQGKVYTWGLNYYGGLGNGLAGDSYVPVAVADGGVSFQSKKILQVAAGSYHSLAIDDQGKVYTWGRNQFGQLGNGNTGTDSNVPVEVLNGNILFQTKKIIQVAAGSSHSIALDDQGKVYTWGLNMYGQLGDSSYTDRDVPVAVAHGSIGFQSKHIIWIAGGLYHTLAVASDGSVYSWGSNGSGQLGSVSTNSSYFPVAVDGTSMGPLPVEMSMFTASVTGTNVRLRWETATEISNYGFDIERSTDKSTWSKIGFIPGSGNSNSTKNYSYTDDTTPVNGKLYYRLKQLDTDGQYEYSKILEVNLGTPAEFALNQNYPNPFNPSTTISFSVPVSGYVSLAIFNLLGEKVAEPINKVIDAGNYTVDFDASCLSSGLYFYTLKAGEYTAVKKMVLTK